MTTSRFVDDLIDAFNSRQIDQIVDHFAPDCTLVDVGQAAPQSGHDSIRQSLVNYLAAASDVRLVCDDLFMDGARLAVVWTARGTHQGTLMRIPPTGRPFTVNGVAVLHVQDGKIIYAWSLWDMAQLLRHIGLLPKL